MADTRTNDMEKVIILVAGGRGARIGGPVPKQYRPVAGKPLIRHTVKALQAALPDAPIQPVIGSADKGLFADSVAGLEGMLPPVFGGETRQESVKNGLEALDATLVSQVFIHDAARPFPTEKVLTGLQKALDAGAQGAVPALMVVDSLVRKEGDDLTPVEREALYSVQTPQAFAFDAILAAHRAATHANFTDDASVLRAHGGRVEIAQGNARNFKVTHEEDFNKAEAMLTPALTDVRTGTGFDVHRFEDGDSVWLGGVQIPHTHSLKGHSDADVALHALTDALLAAIADGDIGHHFPPNDDKWKGARSDVFLSFAADRVRARGGKIGHLGVTIICETPKIGLHKDKIRARIAEIIDTDISRVSVQATTTEKLGFTGRGEGIAAQAVATVRLPEEAQGS